MLSGVKGLARGILAHLRKIKAATEPELNSEAQKEGPPMLRFEFWLCDGQGLPKAERRLEPDFQHAVRDAKAVLSEHPELRKIDLICGETHVGVVGECWSSRSCGANACGVACPIYRGDAPLN